MLISQDTKEIKAALALQSKCELAQVSLRQCHASLEGSEETLKEPFSIRLSHNSTANAISNGVLQIEVRFQFQTYDSGEPPSLLCSIVCAFDLKYEISDNAFQPTAESIAAFKDGNAIFNCWPYVREFMQSTSARMGLRTPPLPLLRIAPRKMEEAQSKNPEAINKSSAANKQ